MRWTPGGVSNDVEDRRGGGGGFGFPFGGGGAQLGCGGFVLLLVLSLVFGRNFFSMVGGGGPVATEESPAGTVQQTPEEEKMVQFVSFVLNDTQATWEKVLPEYRRAKLVLFRDIVQSACGTAQAASGPFYCPADEKVYIDLAFFDELHRRFGAPGDFAQAYVLAHEIGHHVQKVLGIEGEVRQAMQANPSQQNELSIRLELQADCFAGVWGHSTAERQILEAGDVEEGIGAAGAVGDDQIQKMTGRSVNPDSFTHGSAQQRIEWFRRGLESGDVRTCDTFKGM